MTTDREKGQAILDESKRDLRGELVLAGVKPKRGMWIVHPGRGRVYGVILQVRRNGTIRWRGTLSDRNVSIGTVLVAGGYEYRQHARREGVAPLNQEVTP